MMKKLLTICITFIMVIALTACDGMMPGDDNAPTTTPPEQTESPASMPATDNDGDVADNENGVDDTDTDKDGGDTDTDNGEQTDNDNQRITVTGTIISNMSEYFAQYESYRVQYHSVGIRSFGVRFNAPVTLASGATVSEAEFLFDRDRQTEIFGGESLESIDGQGRITTNQSLIDTSLTMTGYLREIPDFVEFGEVTDGRYTVDYFYAPNGAFEFVIVSIP